MQQEITHYIIVAYTIAAAVIALQTTVIQTSGTICSVFFKILFKGNNFAVRRVGEG